MELRRRGILVLPSPSGRMVLSFTHGEKEPEAARATLSGAAEAM